MILGMSGLGKPAHVQLLDQANNRVIGGGLSRTSRGWNPPGTSSVFLFSNKALFPLAIAPSNRGCFFSAPRQSRLM